MTAANTELVGRAQTILASSDVWEMTLPWPEIYWDIETLRRYKRAGFTFISATVQDLPPTFDGVLNNIARIKEAYQSHADWLMIATTLADVDQARAAGKLLLAFNVQDTVQIGTDLARIQILYDIGVWHMLLAYQTRNLVADGCAEQADAGLSNFGRRLVKEMNRVGVVVDCSHTGHRSSMEAMQLSDSPVIFSHSSAYAICPHIRNIRDDQIRACAATGGVVGVAGIGAFLGDPRASTEAAFRHIDHIANLVGPAHVGIGTDYVQNMDYVWGVLRTQKDDGWPDPTGTQLYEGGCFQPEQLTELVQMMLSHGYTDSAVQGILGGNFRRVYRSVLKSSHEA